MANVIKTIIAFRRGTTAEWLANQHVIPVAGEPCYDLELHTLKIGDGTLSYGELPVIGGVDVKFEADGESVVLEDGVFKLFGFDAAEVGAQPRKNASGEVEWVVPSVVDVDGLKKTVDNLAVDVGTIEGEVDTIQSDIADLKAIVGSSDDGSGTLLSRIEGLEIQMDGPGTVNEKIDAKIDELLGLADDNGKVDTIKELFKYVEDHGNDFDGLVGDLSELKGLVGTKPVLEQIAEAIDGSGHISKVEAMDTLLSKIDAKAMYQYVKYEFTYVPEGTLVDYRDSEIRVMCPENTVWTKQSVGSTGNADCHYATFKTYAPNNAVGYIEHINGKSDSEILTNLVEDKYGRKHQTTWLALAIYDGSTWNYYGKNSSAKHYIGYDYRIDWYDENGVMIASDKIRINLSNEDCHHNIEPYFMGKVVKEIAVNGTLLDMVDGRVDIAIPEQSVSIKGSDEIDVAEDGTLSIKSISFDKITQSEEDILIMDGGSAV